MTTPVSVLLGSLEETIPLSERIAVAALQQITFFVGLC